MSTRPEDGNAHVWERYRGDGHVPVRDRRLDGPGTAIERITIESQCRPRSRFSPYEMLGLGLNGSGFRRTAQRGAFTGTVPAFASVSREVASSRAVPIMVATDTRNGAIRRVPAMGTSHT